MDESKTDTIELLVRMIDRRDFEHLKHNAGAMSPKMVSSKEYAEYIYDYAIAPLLRRKEANDES